MSLAKKSCGNPISTRLTASSRWTNAGSQPDVNAGEVIFDLRQFACADDRDHRRRALPKPRQGNLGTTRV
jgi:hypothetical protein